MMIYNVKNYDSWHFVDDVSCKPLTPSVTIHLLMYKV
jgi:hypothetical protein